MSRFQTLILFSALVAVSGCELPQSNEVIDTRIPPTIIEASITPDQVDMGKITTPGSTADVTFRGYVNTADGNGLDDISAVRYSIFAPTGTLFASGTLQDGGVFPDLTAGDGKYNSSIQVGLPRAVIGTYSVQFNTEDKAGFTSNTFSMPISVIYSLNNPPSVSSFIAPDTIFVPSSGTGVIITSVKVSDAEGLNDISAVSLSIIRAEDSSTVAVYGLFDDGGKVLVPPFNMTSGDSIAGDGRFTLAIPVPSNTLRNIQRYFSVFAADQSATTSNVLSKKVVFK